MLQQVDIQDINKSRYTRYEQVIERNHTLGPSMPQVALTLLGPPSLASTNHKSTQGSD